MSKLFKIFITLFITFLILSFAGWHTFNYYWRTKSTVSTFSNFTEPDSLSFSEIIWREGNFGNIKTEIGSFFVKVELNGVNDSFYMQFDTGAPQTVLYGRKLNKLKEKYPNLSPATNDSGKEYFKDAQLKIGDIILETDYLRILPEMGSAEIDSAFNIIGTIGFDAILDRKLILDFRNDKITITNQDVKDLNYSFDLVNGVSLKRFPILLPAQVDDENVNLFYDTGSSMFSLILPPNKLSNMDNSQTIDTLCCISAWGKSLEFYRRKLNSDIKIGKIIENQPDIYAASSMNPYSYFPNWVMMGVTGNQMFLNKVLLIDTKNNIFGISD
ncbi:hypothetical protein [Marivirga sp.]|uniref:hypothetical protein n=1 Tax=Marivirga sp. TaxID=2018662 RepID=UPI002D7EFC12|nr:hypothetical protein [Marivirga sp.]HET8858531.1 hypothetical protein [Marivirga sp.]